MSLSISVAPTGEESLYTPIWVAVVSTNAFTQPNFRYLVDIVVAGNLVVRLRVLPNENNVGVQDVSRILRNYVANYFRPDPARAPFVIDTEGINVFYQLQFGEEYGPTGTITQYLNLTNGIYRAWNAYNTDTPGSMPYLPMAGKKYQWLTSRNTNEVWIARGRRAWVSYLNDDPEDHYLQVQALDDAGQPTGGMYDTLAITALKRLLALDLNLTNIATASWNTAPSPVLPLNSAGYRIRIYRADFSTATPWLNVRFLCEAKTPATALHFLNRFGGFDTFYFTGPTRKEMVVTRKTMERIPIVVNGTSTFTIDEYDTTTNVYADTVLNYATQQSWSRKLTSGHLSDTDHNWLAELIASSQVYLDENGMMFPVTVKDAKWSQKLTRFDKMYTLDLEITNGRQIISQNR